MLGFLLVFAGGLAGCRGGASTMGGQSSTAATPMPTKPALASPAPTPKPTSNSTAAGTEAGNPFFRERWLTPEVRAKYRQERIIQAMQP